MWFGWVDIPEDELKDGSDHAKTFQGNEQGRKWHKGVEAHDSEKCAPVLLETSHLWEYELGHQI